MLSLHRFYRPVVCADENETVVSAARKLRDERVGCVVVTKKGRPIGIVTDRDIAVRVVAEGVHPGTMLLSQISTYDPITIRDSDTIDTALTAIRTHGVRRLAIVDADGRAIGMVTADDLIVLLGSQLGSLAEGLESPTDSVDSR